MPKQRKYTYYFIFIIALFLNISFWLHAKNIQTEWANVPPVPAKENATMMALSDKQLAYRAFGSETADHRSRQVLRRERLGDC